MCRPLFGQSEAVCAFVARFGERVEFGNCQAIGFLSPQSVLEAGVVYHDWNPEAETIELSGAAIHPRWITRERCRLIFDYPFAQIGCQLLHVQTTPENNTVRRVFKALGGKEYAIPRMLGRERARIIITLTAEQWAKASAGKRFALI